MSDSQKASTNTKRNQGMDIAKGLSIYLVVAFHLEAESEWVVYFDALAMPVFFFVSGVFFSKFFLDSSKGGELSQLRRKAARLLRPYIIWSVVSVVCNALLHTAGGGPESFFVFFQHETWEVFLESRSYWFLICLFYTFAYSLTCRAISHRVFGPTNRVALIVIAAAGYVALYTFVYDNPDCSILRFFKFQWLYPYFLVGSCIPLGFVTERMQKARTCKLGFVLVSLLTVAFVLFFVDKDMLSLWMHPSSSLIIGDPPLLAIVIAYYLVGMLGICLVLGLSDLISQIKYLGSAISTVGLLSFDIYVLHMFFVKTILFVTPSSIIQAFPLVHVFAFATGAVVVAIIVLLVNHVLLKSKLYSTYCR